MDANQIDELLKDIKTEGEEKSPLQELLEMIQEVIREEEVKPPEEGETMAHYLLPDVIRLIGNAVAGMAREAERATGKRGLALFKYPNDDSKLIIAYGDGTAHIVSLEEVDQEFIDKLGE